jgi:hypothetical protein
MDDRGNGVEREILGYPDGAGPMAPAALAYRLRMSESSATSLLAALAREGTVRICLVERAPVAERAPGGRAEGARR